MERESSSCYTVDEKLDTLKNDPDSQWKVKEVLYPALRLAETAYDEFIKSVV